MLARQSNTQNQDPSEPGRQKEEVREVRETSGGSADKANAYGCCEAVWEDPSDLCYSRGDSRNEQGDREQAQDHDEYDEDVPPQLLRTRHGPEPAPDHPAHSWN